MTRKSKRELERAVEDLSGDADAVREWVDRYLEQTIAEQGFDVEYSMSPWTLQNPAVAAAPEEEAIIPLLDSADGYVISAPQADVPDWIDLEVLPVEA